MAPVVRAVSASEGLQSVVCVTGQHRQMLDQMLDFFEITADHDLALMRPSQTLPGLTALTLESLTPVLETVRPDWVVVQGDTTTAMAAALAAFYAKIPVAHVEAGLRTGDIYAPFPEEVNRRMIGVVAALHFAPTVTARDALLAEGVDPTRIVVTGNTGIDSLFWTLERARAGLVRAPAEVEPLIAGKRLVLVTAHRRENFDGGMDQIADALKAIAAARPDVALVLPVHPNPKVKGPLEALLGGVKGVHLVSPVDYGPFVALMDRAELILTDSGGIQEEGAAIGKPMLVMRDVTERPEAVSEGVARLVGARAERIAGEALTLLSDPVAYGRMARPTTLFGDGQAAARIAAALETA